VILRGGAGGPNYDAASVAAVAAKLEGAGLAPRIMIDCSHANSAKNHENQPLVAAEVGKQVAAGSRSIIGVMVESFLVAGSQDHTKTPELVYGKSITDKCLDWDRTEALLRDLADSVRKRRS